MRTPSERVGTVFAAGAFIVWGVLPLYWNALSRVAAIEILAHRLLWTSVTVSVFLIVLRRFRLPQLLRDRALRPRLFMSGMLLGVNWFIYIFAVNSGRVLDASMGYYINPLVSVLLGTIVLGERLTLAHGTAVLIAFAAVVFTVVSEGIVPWVALVLAGTFGLYGLLKKQLPAAPLNALAAETSFLVPVGLVIIALRGVSGTWAFAANESSTIVHVLLLGGAGVVTALPLYLFAEGAARIPLSRIGFLQYLAPTLMLGLGVFVFGEPFTTVQAVTFGLIWSALLLYSISDMRSRRPTPPRPPILRNDQKQRDTVPPA